MANGSGKNSIEMSPLVVARRSQSQSWCLGRPSVKGTFRSKSFLVRSVEVCSKASPCVQEAREKRYSLIGRVGAFLGQTKSTRGVRAITALAMTGYAAIELIASGSC